MKTFIINILNWCGFGINGMMIGSTDSFFEKLSEFAKDFKFEVIEETPTTLIVELTNIHDSEEIFEIHYTINATSRKITDIEIVN